MSDPASNQPTEAFIRALTESQPALRGYCHASLGQSDEGLGKRVTFADILGPDKADAKELGALVVEQLAHFLADAPPLGGIGGDFGRVEGVLDDGQVFGDARGPLRPAALDAVIGIFSRPSWFCGIGGAGFFSGSKS